MVKLGKVTIAVVLSIFILGVVLSSSLVGCNKEDEIMGVINDGPVLKGDIPAIDAAAPMKIETATFALG
jgi:hypothetical protein